MNFAVAAAVLCSSLAWGCALSRAPESDANLNVAMAGMPALSELAEVSIVSWNLEWLADPALLESSRFWTTCQARGWPNAKIRPDLPFCDVYKRHGILSATDYLEKKLKPLRSAFAELAARNVDIIAVQEVQQPAALEAVLPQGYRVQCFTTRTDAQNIGYALRTTSRLNVTCREIVELSLENDSQVERPVRRGLELSVNAQRKVLSLLNVHLKSACPRGRLDSRSNDACRWLQHQAQPLESWVEAQARSERAFLIIGDWNRDLEAEIRGNFRARSDGSDPRGPIDAARVRNLFPEINDGEPPASAIGLAKVDRSAAAGRACYDILDQLVVSDTLKAMLDPGSLRQGQVVATLIRGPAGGLGPLRVEGAFEVQITPSLVINIRGARYSCPAEF